MWEPVKENELTRNSSGNTRPQSSQLAALLWTDPGLKEKWNWCARADLQRRRGDELSNLPTKYSQARKKPPLPPPPPLNVCEEVSVHGRHDVEANYYFFYCINETVKQACKFSEDRAKTVGDGKCYIEPKMCRSVS